MDIKILLLVSLMTLLGISLEDIQVSPRFKKVNHLCHSDQSIQQYKYEGESLNERIQRNTFSEVASFTISSHLFETDDADGTDNQSMYIPKAIKSRAYSSEEDDTPPEGWQDPNKEQGVPIGEIPWGLMSLLISISLFFIQRSRGSSLG
jgi:hypothetical protein